jgi:hypothetical protein
MDKICRTGVYKWMRSRRRGRGDDSEWRRSMLYGVQDGAAITTNDLLTERQCGKLGRTILTEARKEIWSNVERSGLRHVQLATGLSALNIHSGDMCEQMKREATLR